MKNLASSRTLFEYSQHLQTSNFDANEELLQQMIQSNKALLSLIDSIPVTFFLFSYIDLSVKYISIPQLSALFRFPESVIRQHITEKGMYYSFELMHPADLKILTADCFNLANEIMKDIPISLREKVKYTNNYRVTRGDGTEGKVLSQFCVVVHPETGVPLYGIGSLTDITDQKTDTKIIFKAEFFDELNGNKTYIKDFYPDANEDLSEREIEIALFLAQGKKPQQIADSLFISPYTVKAHKRNIFEKLNIHSNAELTLILTKKGLL